MVCEQPAMDAGPTLTYRAAHRKRDPHDCKRRARYWSDPPLERMDCSHTETRRFYTVSNDVKLLIMGTFAIVALAWIVTNASKLGPFTQALASSYGTAVNALKPSGG